MPVQPLKPSQVEKKKHEILPDGVIEAFNELIAKHWNGSYSEFTQSEVVALVLVKTGTEREQTLYDNKWLDVEDVYRKRAGTSNTTPRLL
jgi:hypothetical protein